jgi:hypothetical protein
MTLRELKSLFRNEQDKHFRLRLPDGSPVPGSFHITEVGRVQKTFIDCGGVLRESVVCQLQVWVGPDEDHRIEARKAAAILDKAKAFLPDESVPVEIEYEDRVISQYTISGGDVLEDAVILTLEHKHTACLAAERCGVAPGPEEISLMKPAAALKVQLCCAPGCCA